MVFPIAIGFREEHRDSRERRLERAMGAGGLHLIFDDEREQRTERR